MFARGYKGICCCLLTTTSEESPSTSLYDILDMAPWFTPLLQVIATVPGRN